MREKVEDGCREMQKSEKSVKALGGIECDSVGYRKSGSQIADRKRVETKSSARRFADHASGAAGVRSINLAENRSINFARKLS